MSIFKCFQIIFSIIKNKTRMKNLSIIIILLFISFSLIAEIADNQHASLCGIVKNAKNEMVIGATIYLPELKTGAITDSYGQYRIEELPVKSVLVQVSSLGYKMQVMKVQLSDITQKDFVLEETIIEINEIAVTGQSGAVQMQKMPAPVTLISNRELREHSSTNLIDAISNQPGISQITTGSGISKPVIRGLGYNRIVVMNDGIRQEGQQWGDEHGIEMDEFDVDRVEILKGPASLMYGSDAMAGVINFLSAPILPVGFKKLNLLLNYQTNNGLYAYSLNFAGHKKSYFWDLRISNKAAHAYRNKFDGFVYNSGFSENAISALIGVNKWWGYSHLTLSTYQLTPGIVEGLRDSSTGDFLKPFAANDGSFNELPADNKDFMSYKHGIPYQQVNHYKAVMNNNILIGDGSLKSTFGFQQNSRQEFEDVLHPNNYGLFFRLNTLNYSLYYQAAAINGTEFSFGISGMYQNSDNRGSEFLIPAYQLFDIGTFAMFRKSIGKFDISGGLRYDHRNQHIDALYLDQNEEITYYDNPQAVTRFMEFDGNFTGISGSTGVSFQPDQQWNLKLNISKGFRAPNISELSANGVHEGTQRYESGNLALRPESSLQIDAEAGFSSHHVNMKFNLFSNSINNFIFAHKLNTLQGTDSVIDNDLVFKYFQGKAHLYGGEFSIDIHPHPLDWLHFENSFSFVNAQQLQSTDSTMYLPFTPAPKWKSDLRAEFNKIGKYLKNSFISLGLDYYFRQDKVFSAFGTETPTPACLLLNASLGSNFILNKQTISVFLNATNLADAAYQNHLSRLKYTPVNNDTGRTGVFNMGRNVSLKVIVPVNL